MRYFVSAWLWNLQTSGTSAMIPIQSSQVRGGTRISVPFLSFLPLSLCLSSAMSKNSRGTLTRLTSSRNHGLPNQPTPFQQINRPIVELETFPDAHPFHPEQLPRRRRSDNQLMALSAGNLPIHEQILQFDRRFHADRLKAVPCPPMAKHDRRSDPFRVEILAPFRELRPSIHRSLPGPEPPINSQTAKVHRAVRAFQFHGNLLGSKGWTDGRFFDDAPAALTTDRQARPNRYRLVR